MRLHFTAVHLLTCLAGLLVIAVVAAIGANSTKLLEGNVREEKSISPSLKVLTEPTTPKFERQGSFSVPSNLIKNGSTTPAAGTKPDSILRSTVNLNDGKLKGIGAPTPGPSLVPPKPPMWYAPGYEVIRHPQPKVSAKTPSEKAAAGTNQQMSNFDSNRRSAVVETPPSTKGVTSWKPGYEVRKVHSSATANVPNAKTNSTKRAMPVTRSAGPPVLMATPLLLPELRTTTGSQILTWNEWYGQMAKALYSRWQYSDVGPGVAMVRVTITSARDVYCRLISFTPADGIDRNIKAETRFREAAVRSVNNVRPFEIPNLPALNGRKSVIFDVEMRRMVDGPVGVNISRKDSHSQEDKPSKIGL